MQSPGSDKFARPAPTTPPTLEATRSLKNAEEGLKTVNDVERGFPIDEAPEGDAVEQQRSVEFDDEAGLDTDYLSAADREASEADVIEQAFVVPADDEWGDDH